MTEKYSHDPMSGSSLAERLAYDEWLVEKINAARADPRPSIAHEVVKEKVRMLLANKKNAGNDDR
jgi:ribosome-binding protein aMBF1 (putative translation factor)